jgi:uncharacterized Zn-finger protein
MTAVFNLCLSLSQLLPPSNPAPRALAKDRIVQFTSFKMDHFDNNLFDMLVREVYCENALPDPGTNACIQMDDASGNILVARDTEVHIDPQLLVLSDNGEEPLQSISWYLCLLCLIGHARIGNHICHICKKRFSRKLHLDIHMASHSDSRPFVCDSAGCGKTFKISDALRRHSKQHNSDRPRYRCTWENCGQEFLSKLGLRNHHGTHNKEKPFRCDLCGAFFARKELLSLHQNGVHFGKKPWICEVRGCSWRGSQKGEFKRHHLEHNGQRSFICGLNGCHKGFLTKKELKQHQKSKIHLGTRKREKIYTCHLWDCTWTGTSPKDVERHTQRHAGYKPFVCTSSGCKKDFLTESEWTSHRQRKHEERSFECALGDCHSKFPTEKLLHKHQIRAKLHRGTTQKKPVPLSKKPLACDRPGCGWRCIKPYQLRAHLMKHDGKKPFPCTIPGCDFALSSKAERNQHLKQMHGVVSCTFLRCHSSFASKEDMENHRSNHSFKVSLCGQKKIECTWPGCVKKFTCQSRLDDHLKRHADQREYVCDWPRCAKGLNTRNDLIQHRKRHTAKNRFPCDHSNCSKNFPVHSELVQHLRTHKKEKDFVCSWDDCDRSFTQQEALTLHFRDHTGEKPCQCTWKDCEERFAQPKQLQKHMKSHIGEMGLTANEGCYSDLEHELSMPAIHTSSGVEDIEMGDNGRKTQGGRSADDRNAGHSLYGRVLRKRCELGINAHPIKERVVKDSSTISLSKKRKSDPQLEVANKRQNLDDHGSGRALSLRSGKRKPKVGAEIPNKSRKLSDEPSGYSLRSRTNARS